MVNYLAMQISQFTVLIKGISARHKTKRELGG
jgi:hypothetical protein